jgi:ring-1,2-phenylacetyl-CoA epoxidase subunit PaaE
VSVSTKYHSLTIAEIRRETPDAVAVRFHVPDALAGAFDFSPGQYLTLRQSFGGEELRRCYSLCAPPGGDGLWIGVREESGGRFSGWLNTEAKPGDQVQVMPPDGRFTFHAEPGQSGRNVLLVAAGSGITPVISILETLLAEEPDSSATLLYANRDSSHIMFKDALDDLKDRHLERLRVFHILSREPSDVELVAGRIDQAKCEAFFGQTAVAPAADFDLAYLCGPLELMDLAAGALERHGLSKGKIKRELFLNVDSPDPAGRPTSVMAPVPEGAQITIILDQRQRTLTFDGKQTNILDLARAAGMDVPFACKAGVCATCRAHLSAGEITMARNQALEDDELSRGFILTCQASPVTDQVTVDYDRRSG